MRRERPHCGNQNESANLEDWHSDPKQPVEGAGLTAQKPASESSAAETQLSTTLQSFASQIERREASVHGEPDS